MKEEMMAVQNNNRITPIKKEVKNSEVVILEEVS